MKEAFEKIRNGIAEAINVSKAENYQYENGFIPPCNYTVIDVNDRVIEALIEALSIVSEVEAEYGNGWIPCSERLSEKDAYCLVTYESGKIGIMEYLETSKWGWNGEFADNRVIAWQPLPLPYQPQKEV